MGGEAVNGGNVFVNGFTAESTFTMEGGTICNGTSSGNLDAVKSMIKAAYDGDNIFATSATVNISGGVITDDDGGNAILAFTSKADRPAVINLTAADKEAFDGKIYLVVGAQLNVEGGSLQTDSDGDQIWVAAAAPVRSTRTVAPAAVVRSLKAKRITK